MFPASATPRSRLRTKGSGVGELGSDGGRLVEGANNKHRVRSNLLMCESRVWGGQRGGSSVVSIDGRQSVSGRAEYRPIRNS